MTDKDKEIKCLACFDTLDSTENRMNNPASFTKLSYVFGCLERLGYDVDILSGSYAVGKEDAKGSTRKISERTALTTIDSKGRGNKIKNAFSLMCFYTKLKRKLKEFIKDGDTLLVYHSLGYLRIVKWLRKHKDIKLLLEVEEIYGHVSGSEKTAKRELEFFKIADGYIYCNRMLKSITKSGDKPCAVSHGAYKTEDYIPVSFDDEKIHIVYAGTFDPRKGGVHTALSAAEFLDKRYHLHILGFGTEQATALVLSKIDEINKFRNCKVTYDGCLSGEEYYDFLRKCHIGLSTQTPQGVYNDSSFPSKVLVYMANGLRVVSVRIPAIENSDVGEYMCFYDESSPREVAKAISSIDLSIPYNGRKIIDKLDEKFMGDLETLLNKL